jgi:hypothetical protein
MRSDFKTWMLVVIFGLPFFLLGFIVMLYVGNCGFKTNCSTVDLPEVIHTPIPTLIPATLPAPEANSASDGGGNCLVSARDLLSDWVTAGYPQTDRFDVQDVNNTTCQATFANVQPLFTEPNLWYKGTLSCASCHNSNISNAAAQLDLSSYAGILAGSRRTSPNAKGSDILGGGDWDKSLLNQMLFVRKLMPLGHPAGAGDVLVSLGSQAGPLPGK